jgi:hypothetical protein
MVKSIKEITTKLEFIGNTYSPYTSIKTSLYADTDYFHTGLVYKIKEHFKGKECEVTIEHSLPTSWELTEIKYHAMRVKAQAIREGKGKSKEK